MEEKLYGGVSELGPFNVDLRGLLVALVVHKGKARGDFGVLFLQDGGNGVVLGDMLALAAHHEIDKVGVSGEIELVGLVDADAPVLKQLGQGPVDNGGANLGLPVVAQNGNARFGAAGGNRGVGGEKFGNAVHNAAARLFGAVHIESGGLGRTGGQVDQNDIHLIIDEGLDNINGLLAVVNGEIFLAVIMAQVLRRSVQGGASQDWCVQKRYVRDFVGAVGLFPDRLAHVPAHFFGINVESEHNLDVAGLVAAHIVVHQAPVLAGNLLVLIELDAFHQRSGAIAHAHQGKPDFLLSHSFFLPKILNFA
ncbi:hypothetical protein SDC9_70739 [bioreactor metagenome]|uniref:NAD-specific glutamate dehydrogenase n=1 Tax=bioreactor metagenome TaxID=1076179 RepID=A0A644Y8K1_9ZZZZ